MSVTNSGKTCQRWDADYPHPKHNDEYGRKQRDPTSYPDSSIADAANYCRNPDWDKPYCYTTDPNKRFEKCDIPKCAPG